MTGPTQDTPTDDTSLLARVLRPRVVLPALGVLLVVTVLFAPTVGDTRNALTTHSTSAGGARGLQDIARRLGWRTVRRDVRLTSVPRLDSTATYAVLAPVVDVSVEETHVLLDAVRRGAGLLVVPQRGSPLSDSLGIAPASFGAPQLLSPADSTASCTDDQNRRGLIDWAGTGVQSFWLVPRVGLPDDTVVFARLQATAETRRRVAAAGADTLKGALGTAGPDGILTAAVGFALGRGRVVVVADPDWLRNDVLRVCEWNAAPQAARMLDYLRGSPSAGGLLVFDEYHQGYGRHASTSAVIRSALEDTPPGRAVLQAVAAALVLLAAVGARALPPRPRTRFERRSPLEHVGALAHAYGQVGATRTAARRLVRGLRRRHTVAAVSTARVGTGGPSGSGASSDDDLFLDAVVARHPAVAPDVTALRVAMAEGGAARGSSDDARRLGTAAAAIDAALRS